jgi:hypothetical protein
MATTSSASKVGELCTVIRFSAISVDTMEWMRVSNGRSASLTAMGGRIAAGTRWRSSEADRPACPFERLPTTLVTIIAVGLYACGLDSAGQYWEGWPSDWGRSMGLRIFRSIAGPQTRAVFASTHEAFQSERCRCRSRYRAEMWPWQIWFGWSNLTKLCHQLHMNSVSVQNPVRVQGVKSWCEASSFSGYTFVPD